MSDEPHKPEGEQYAHPDAPGIIRRKRAQRRLFIIAAAVLVGGGALWYFEHSLSFSLDSVLSIGSSIESSTLHEIFSAPTPLRTNTPATPNSTLTRAGVITNTNTQRAANGNLPPFTENALLDDVATLRLDDMFQNQYFAHVSPYTSSSAETVAKTVGYSYIALGENLALGNFAGDKGVVVAWMNSPGHRANILNTHYTQIGVAVRKGTFQGETTWIAVQVFGRPASDCPAPDATLKAQIDAAEVQLTAMEQDLQNKKTTLDAAQPKSGPEYNQQVDAYNAEVAQYNSLASQTKVQVTQYNGEVNAFNACLSS